MQTSYPSIAATRLSEAAQPGRRLFRFFRLARVSLLLSVVSMLTGCLVEDPPAFAKPTRTPPRIDLRLAEPSLDRIIVVGRGDPINFLVPVVSEDAGVQIRAYLFLDNVSQVLSTHAVPASTLDDTSRRLELAYRPLPQWLTTNDPRLAKFGCHRFTARVSHVDNYATDGTTLGVPLDLADVAEVYWWVNVVNVAAGEDDTVLRNCPDPVSASP